MTLVLQQDMQDVKLSRSMLGKLDCRLAMLAGSCTVLNMAFSLMLITGMEDAGSVYARGYCGVHTEILDLIRDQVRTMTEQCSHPEGFIIFRSFGGGTGSGFTSLLMDKIFCDYVKKSS
ncbi:hypothetical protein B7P43_G10409 [Cryptotermes secundus]|uniref:Tubulin alpha chain n=1 Tax=Cryptotermes secundus TaxID=105785 RepID=A0A2J7QEP2_9NEOP|nr:hypothetical protein B7P43_G10409 [Cryptotermes secundus]